MSTASTSLVIDSSAVHPAVPHGASHHPREGQELVPVLLSFDMESIFGILIDLEMCLLGPKGTYYQLVFHLPV
jgi:hypothetical protein